MEANSGDFNPMVLFVALLLIVGFTAIFYQRWKWDQYEQRYRELVAKRDRGAGTGPPAAGVSEAGVTPEAGAPDPDVADLGAKGDTGTDAGSRSSEAKK